MKTKRVNRESRKSGYKPSSKRGGLASKPKQEAYNHNQDQYQELFPQLGASPTKTTKNTTKQSQPVKQQQAQPQPVSKKDIDTRDSK